MAFETSSSPRFFALEVAVEGTADTEFEATELNVGEGGAQCPRCNTFLGSLPWLPPYRGLLKLHGQGFGDLIRAPGDEFLMSERMVEAFQREGLKGLSGFHPVEIVGVRKGGRRQKSFSAPKYFCVSPAFLSAAVDESHSRIRRSKPSPCTYCRSTGVDAIHGFAIEAGSWNGDDVFRPRGLTGDLVVSDPFKRFVVRHGFTNMKLTPTEDFVIDFYPSRPRPSMPDPYTPGSSG